MPQPAPAVSRRPATETSSSPARQLDRSRCTQPDCSPAGECRRLIPAGHIDDLEPLADALRARVLGQSQATEALISSLSRLLSGLRDPSRPLLTALLLGPTGVGKTETARALAHGLFGDERAMVRINCEELAHSHELAKLLGSPPGYVGQEIEPLLSQARLDAAHLEMREGGAAGRSLAEHVSALNDGEPISIVLFDEIEKAHPVIWSSLLGILENGSLTLGDNRTVDFTRSIVLMTSNIGSREMGELLDPPHTVGFTFGAAQAAADRSRGLHSAVESAARSHFPLEFLNRFDEKLVYQPLDRKALEKIFDKFLDEIHQRALYRANTPLLLRISPEARDWILDQGTDPALGARPLRRVMERQIIGPLSRLIASRQIDAGDVIEIAREDGQLAFYRRQRESQKIVA